MASLVLSTGAPPSAPAATGNSPASSPGAGLSSRISDLDHTSSSSLRGRAEVLKESEIESAPRAFYFLDIISTNLKKLKSPVKNKQIKAAIKTARLATQHFAASFLEKAVIPRGTKISRFRTLRRTVLGRKNGPLVVLDKIDRKNISAKREGIFAYGGFKHLYRAIDPKTGQVYAVARLEKNNPLFRKNHALIRQEIVYFDIFKETKGIAQAEVINESDSAIFIVMDYREYGDLFKYIDNVCHRKFLPINQLLTSAHRMLQGLIAVHEKGIIHRDIKPGNFLAYKETVGVGTKEHEVLRADLADFGLAVHESKVQNLCGTPPFFAPELEFGVKQSKASDMFAFGLTLLALFSLKPDDLFPHTKLFKIIIEKKDPEDNHLTYDQLRTKYALEYNSYLDSKLREDTPAQKAISNVIRRLLDLDPTKRGTAEQALDDLMGYITLAESLTQPVEVSL